jgi:hypothetical protein
MFYRNDSLHVTYGEAFSYFCPFTISQHNGTLSSCHSSNRIAKDVTVFHKTPYMTTYLIHGLQVHDLLSSSH